MKKFFALAIVALLFATAAYAQLGPGGYNDDQGNQEFQIYVICPIQVNPDGATVSIGTIIPGQVKTLTTGNAAQFTVTGHTGESFTGVGVVTTTGSQSGSPTGSVTITGYHWEEYNGSSWQNYDGTARTLLGGSGGNDACDALRYIRAVVDQVTATNNASSGNWTFPVTFTATYVGV